MYDADTIVDKCVAILPAELVSLHGVPLHCIETQSIVATSLVMSHDMACSLHLDIYTVYVLHKLLNHCVHSS